MPLNNILFLGAWILVPLIWLHTLKLGGMRVLTLSLPSFVVTFILVFQYAGFPILYFKLDDYRARFVTDQNLVLKAWCITSFTTFLICLGAFSASIVFGSIEKSKIHHNRINTLAQHSIKKIYTLGLIGIIVLLAYTLKIGFSNIALIKAFNGASMMDIALARSKMGNDFGRGYYWYNFFMRDVLIFVSLVFLAIQLNKVQKIQIITLILLMPLVAFSLTMATEKGLFVDYIITIYILYIIMKKHGTISLKMLIPASFFIMISLVIFYMVFAGNVNLITSVSYAFSRALTGSLQPIYHYLDFFPAHHDWLYGASFPNPGGIFPFKPYNLTVELMNFVDPSHYETKIIGTMPAIYWGEIYANFGYYGLVIAPPLIGFLLYFINWIICSLDFDPLNAAFFTWLLMHYKNLSITSISMFVFDFNLYMMLLLMIFIRMRIVSCRIIKKSDDFKTRI